MGNKVVVGGPVRSEYDHSFKITGVGGGEGGIEGNIWKDSALPQITLLRFMMDPSKSVMLVSYIPPLPRSEFILAYSFFVSYSNTLLCPSEVSLKTKGLWLLSTMTHSDGAQPGWPCTRTATSV